MRALLLVALGALVLAGPAAAHAPFTAIGRAVTALEQVPVSHDPESVVGEVEAGGFPAIVGDDVSVAFMPSAALSEIRGGPNAVASEIAREAGVEGSLVVLVGRRLGAWSEDIGEERLAALVAAASSTLPAGSPAAAVESLVRAVQAEPKGSGPPWGWIGLVLLVGATAALVALHRAVTRRP